MCWRRASNAWMELRSCKVSMSPAICQLDDLIAFNDQLLALDEAGVPIALSSGSRDLAADLEKINSLLARHVSRGEPIDKTLEMEPDVPYWYRTLALSTFTTNNTQTAMAHFTNVRKSADSSRYIT